MLQQLQQQQQNEYGAATRLSPAAATTAATANNAPDLDTLKDLLELDANNDPVVWPKGLNAKKTSMLIKEIEAAAAREEGENLVRGLEEALGANEEAERARA